MRRFFDVLESVGGFFDVVTYTGNGSTQSIDLGFEPDFVWIKAQNAATDHEIYDSIRGSLNKLSSNTTAAESVNTNGLTSFNLNGFTVGSSLSQSGVNYVAWAWKSGGTAVSNTDGSITSQVSANQEAGFSIVSYAGVSGGGSWGHGLSSSPELIIFKRYTAAQNWFAFVKINGVWHYLEGLNNTSAAVNYSSNMSVNNSNVALPSLAEYNNDTNSTYIAYCFHSVDGYQKTGSYTGNGSATGPVITTGFEPSFLLIKRTDSTGNWVMLDNQRSLFNPRDKALYSNLSNAETTAEATDFLTNGFQPITTSANINASGGTYIYLAIK